MLRTFFILAQIQVHQAIQTIYLAMLQSTTRARSHCRWLIVLEAKPHSRPAAAKVALKKKKNVLPIPAHNNWLYEETIFLSNNFHILYWHRQCLGTGKYIRYRS